MLDFGSYEPWVRWIEQLSPAEFEAEAAARVRSRREDRGAWLLAGALASVRSVDPSRCPSWLLQLGSALALLDEVDSVLEGAEEDGDLAVLTFLRQVSAEHAAHPFQLPAIEGQGEGAKEDLTYAFLEAVHRGDAETADLQFSWLASDLGREEAGDLLFSSGLQALTGASDTLLGAVEALSALQRIGWVWGPALLRPVVRQQATGGARSDLYDRACQEVAQRHLLRRARRRTPGAPSLGETDPKGFLRRAMEWSQSDPEGRMAGMAEALAAGVTLEDAGEVVSLAATLLFLQEGLRTSAWSHADLEPRLSIVTGARAVRRLLHLGTPGQRVLALLLVGGHPGIRHLRIRPEAPECGWWLSPATRWSESPRTAEGEGERETVEDPDRLARWIAALEERRSNVLLPLLEEDLERGISVAGLGGPIPRVAVRQASSAAHAVALERTLAEAYHATRAPHRWIHLWASGLAQCSWPVEPPSIQGLQGQNPSANFWPGSGP